MEKQHVGKIVVSGVRFMFTYSSIKVFKAALNLVREWKETQDGNLTEKQYAEDQHNPVVHVSGVTG